MTEAEKLNHIYEVKSEGLKYVISPTPNTLIIQNQTFYCYDDNGIKHDGWNNEKRTTQYVFGVLKGKFKGGGAELLNKYSLHQLDSATEFKFFKMDTYKNDQINIRDVLKAELFRQMDKYAIKVCNSKEFQNTSEFFLIYNYGFKLSKDGRTIKQSYPAEIMHYSKTDYHNTFKLYAGNDLQNNIQFLQDIGVCYLPSKYILTTNKYYLFNVQNNYKCQKIYNTLEELYEDAAKKASSDTQVKYIVAKAKSQYPYYDCLFGSSPQTPKPLSNFVSNNYTGTIYAPSASTPIINTSPEEYTNDLINSLYTTTESTYKTVDEIIVDSKGGSIQSYIDNLLDYELEFFGNDKINLNTNDYVANFEFDKSQFDTTQISDKYYDYYENRINEVELYKEAHSDGVIDERIQNSTITNFEDSKEFFKMIDEYLNLDFDNNKIWKNDKRPFTKEDLIDKTIKEVNENNIKIQVTAFPVKKENYINVIKKDSPTIYDFKNTINSDDLKTFTDYFYSDNRKDYIMVFFIIDEEGNITYAPHLTYSDFFNILNKTLIYVKHIELQCDINIIQDTNNLNLYELSLFEAYTRGRDFIQEKYTSVRPSEMINEKRLMNYDDNYFCYKYTGRDFNLSNMKEVGGTKVGLVHESDLLTEVDITLGENYKREKYFIEAIKYDINKKPINSKDAIISEIKPDYKYMDTFKIKDFVAAVDETKYIEEDLEIITDYIDLNSCEFYEPEKANFENNWRDCYCSDNTTECIYQKEGYCPYRFMTEKHPRRIRSLSQEKSNRFNLIQELSKVFKIYPQFYIKHDDRGKVILNEKGEMQKFVFFITEKGKTNPLGFRYERNLTNIDRTVDSTQLTTKLYVQSVDSDLSNTGLCTIETAVDNISRENYLIDFDYYIKKGNLNEEQVYRDLYGIEKGDLAFLPTVGHYNREYDNLTNSIINITGETMTEIQAKKDILVTSVQAALEARQEVAQKMYQFKKSYLERTSQYTTETYDVTDTYKNYLTKYKEQALIMWSNIEQLFFNDNYFCYIIKSQENDEYNYEFHSIDIANPDDSLVGTIIKLNNTEWKVENIERYCKGELFWRIMIKGFDELPDYVPPFDTWQDFKESIIDENLYIINGLLGQYKSLYEQVKKWKTDRAKWLQKKQKIVDKFYKKYEPYIKEGTWSDSNFLTDNEYYLAAQSVLDDSSKLNTTYNISVIDISSLDEFKDFEFDLADLTYVEDIDFFGINQRTGLPNKEKVLISGITYVLDQPDNNTIQVQNYTTQFDDIFESISASVQSLTFNENTYKRASNFTALKYVSQESLQGTLDEGDLILMNAVNDNITVSEDGTKGKDINNTASQYQLTGQGLEFSNDGGQTWDLGVGPKGMNADYIKFGSLDASKIQIVDGQYQYFLWDKDGINSYRDPSSSSRGLVDFARFNKYGLSLIENNNVRLRAGYAYLSNEEDSGDYRTERGLTNQSVGFYLYNDSGQPIFKTETQSDYQNKNGDYSARLSLKGEMFITNKVLSTENDGSIVTASLIKTYKNAYETDYVSMVDLNDLTDDEKFVYDNQDQLSTTEWLYEKDEEGKYIIYSEVVSGEEEEKTLYYGKAFKKANNNLFDNEKQLAAQIYSYNNNIVMRQIANSKTMNYYMVTFEIVDNKPQPIDDSNITPIDADIVTFNLEQFSGKAFTIGTAYNHEIIVKSYQNITYKSSSEVNDREVNLYDFTNDLDKLNSTENFISEVPMLIKTLSILDFNEQYPNVKYWDNGKYTDISVNDSLSDNYNVTKTKQVGIFINNKVSASGGSDIVNNDISGINNLDLSTTIGVTTTTEGSGVPSTVMAAAKVCKAHGDSNISRDYSHNTHTITVDGKQISLRTDCTGLVTATLQYMGYDLEINGDGTFSSIVVKKDGNVVSGDKNSEWWLIDSDDNYEQKPGDILFEKNSSNRHAEIYVYARQDGKLRGFSYGSTDGIQDSIEFGNKILSNGLQATIDTGSGHSIYPNKNGSYLFVLRYMKDQTNISTSTTTSVTSNKPIFESDSFVFIGDSVTEGLNTASNSANKDKYVGHGGYAITSTSDFNSTDEQKQLINKVTQAAFFFGLNNPQVADNKDKMFESYEATIEKILHLNDRATPINTIYIVPPMLPTGHPTQGQTYVKAVQKFIEVLADFKSLKKYPNIQIINLAQNQELRNQIDTVKHASDGYHSGNYPELANRIEKFFNDNYSIEGGGDSTSYRRYNYQDLESTVQRVIHGSERLFMISLLGENEKTKQLQYNNIMTITKSGVLYMGGQIMDYYGRDIPNKDENFEYLPDEISVKNAPLVLTNSGYVWIDLERFLIINGQGGYTGISLKDLLTNAGAASVTAEYSGIEPTTISYDGDELIERYNKFMSTYSGTYKGLITSATPKNYPNKSRLVACQHLFNYLTNNGLYPRMAVVMLANAICENIDRCISNEGNSCSWGIGTGPEGQKDCGIWAFHTNGPAYEGIVQKYIFPPESAAKWGPVYDKYSSGDFEVQAAYITAIVTQSDAIKNSNGKSRWPMYARSSSKTLKSCYRNENINVTKDLASKYKENLNEFFATNNDVELGCILFERLFEGSAQLHQDRRMALAVILTYVFLGIDIIEGKLS